MRPKTFEITTRRLGPGETVVVAKSHSSRTISTRTHHPGLHVVTVRANGLLSPRAEFELLPDVRISERVARRNVCGRVSGPAR